MAVLHEGARPKRLAIKTLKINKKVDSTKSQFINECNNMFLGI